MKIIIKIGDNQYEFSDVTDHSIRYTLNEITQLIEVVVEQNNKIQSKWTN